MRRWVAVPILFGCLCLVAADAPKPALPEKAENFTLADLDGRRWTLHNLKDVKAVVLYFTGTECPLANRYIGRVNQLHGTFVRKGVIVLAVNPNGLESVEHIRKHQKETGLAVNVLLDREQKVADQLKVEVTPTVVVLDASWRVRYRGQFDDSHIEGHVKKRYVRDAIAAILDGYDVPLTQTEPWGCTIQRDVKETASDVTYAEHVAPILRTHCVGCHRPGGDAPFALTTYEEARRWAGTMQAFTRSKRMPPWKPVNPGAFHGERFMPDADVETLRRWLAGGTPRGDDKKLAPLPKFADGWSLGTPDLVLTTPEYEVPGQGDDQFRCFVLPTALPADIWVRGVEVRPGNRRVAHHAIVYLDTSRAAEKLDEAAPGPGYPSSGASPGFAAAAELGGWAPGTVVRPLPDKVGTLLPKGARVVVMIHYHPTGRLEKDRTQVGLYFAPKPVEKPLRRLEVANRSFEIPAGAKRHRLTAEQVLAEDVHALAIRPLLNYLGREVKVRAELPDRTTRLLLHITDWDFHWQETYHFKEPVALPRGTRLIVEAWYDNSADNPYNPNILPRAVVWGEKMTDEQCAALLLSTRDGERLENGKGQ